MVNRRVPEGQEFILANGKAVRSIEELLEYLQESSDKDFVHHVGPHRNDFALWIKEVHGNEELADEITIARTKKKIIKVLQEVVDEHYERKASQVRKELHPRKHVYHQPSHQRKVTSRHGEFITEEFIYGLIFGFVFGVLTYGVLINLI